jgi:glyoxylase-like metal-dependent hydrolase (beta-lactamase superfamily II)
VIVGRAVQRKTFCQNIRRAKPRDAQVTTRSDGPNLIASRKLLSHYHDDHTANANDYRGSTWLVQKAERDAMFTDPPPRFADASFYSALKDSKTVVINNTDHDIFGDGSVVLKFAPGHTPGHQMLLLRLPKTGLVFLSGDIYHLPGEREKLTEIPTSDSNRDVSLVTRPAIESFIKQSGAWFSMKKNSSPAPESLTALVFRGHIFGGHLP